MTNGQFVAMNSRRSNLTCLPAVCTDIEGEAINASGVSEGNVLRPVSRRVGSREANHVVCEHRLGAGIPALEGGRGGLDSSQAAQSEEQSRAEHGVYCRTMRR